LRRARRLVNPVRQPLRVLWRLAMPWTTGSCEINAAVRTPARNQWKCATD
jgi:hypothetical protein